MVNSDVDMIHLINALGQCMLFYLFQSGQKKHPDPFYCSRCNKWIRCCPLETCFHVHIDETNAWNRRKGVQFEFIHMWYAQLCFSVILCNESKHNSCVF